MAANDVRLRGGFSDRNMIKAENTSMQLNSLDLRTRTFLINATNKICNAFYEESYDKMQSFIRDIYENVYLKEIDSGTKYVFGVALESICKTIREDSYSDVLTLIEYIANSLKKHYKIDTKFIEDFYNKVFESEYLGYRIINGVITPITNPIEIASIEEATKTEYTKANEFLIKASVCLSDRKNPDYENSIKESISAVEAICNIVIGKKGTLGAALDKLEAKGLVIHPSLKVAIDKLYGYTSDASGIRHAGDIGGKASTFEEARFMLVACSAFVNYLLENYEKHQ